MLFNSEYLKKIYKQNDNRERYAIRMASSEIIKIRVLPLTALPDPQRIGYQNYHFRWSQQIKGERVVLLFPNVNHRLSAVNRWFDNSTYGILIIILHHCV